MAKASSTSVNESAADESPPTSLQGEDERRRSFHTDELNCLATVKEDDRTGEITEPRILNQLVCNSKEDRKIQISPEPEKAEYSLRRESLQDGFIGFDLPLNLQKGFLYFPGSEGCNYDHPDPRILKKQAIRAWVQNKCGKISYDSVTFHNPSGYDNQLPQDETEGTFFQGQGPPKGSCKDFENGINDIEMPCQLYRKSTSDVDSLTAGPTSVEETNRIEE
ncbi:hypothetical protein AYI70_g9018 [Smittium culicis]|uniref:Uncharacterized protein n=1 Tax=Smittium culicis TaxID=133412 RepID=A0A1R1XD78_9FUNG|nr:hypothetical protein AYI70_g9018 [Smittium culicis]